MKVRDLKQIIDRLKDDDELRIIIKTMAGSIGTLPSIKAKGFYQGNDWEHGQVLIEPEQELHVGGDTYKEEQKSSRDKDEALAFISMHLKSKQLDDKQKLNAIRQTIKRFGFNT